MVEEEEGEGYEIETDEDEEGGEEEEGDDEYEVDTEEEEEEDVEEDDDEDEYVTETEEEDDEENDEDEEEEEEGDVNAQKKTSHLIHQSIGTMKKVCTKAGLAFPVERITKIWLSLRKYLNRSSPEGPESGDRRFHLSHEGLLHFHGRFKDITVELNKVLASLTLNQSHLFQYVVERGKQHDGISRYTNDEKVLIKNLVRLANLRKTQIPCQKIRAFC